MRKKSKIDEIGKMYYQFDEQNEIVIYNRLCFRKTKKKCGIEYYTYSSWKGYILSKYSSYTKEQLIEFSRFLNQKIRNVEPGHEYWNIIIPIVMTVVVDRLFLQIFNIDQSWLSSWLLILIEIVIIIAVVAMSLFFIYKFFEPLFEVYDKENFYKDYKEIIDEIISNK